MSHSLRTGSGNLQKALEMCHGKTEGMGADILGDVMRNRAYCDSRMLRHVTCTHAQASLALLHTNQQIVLYSSIEIKFTDHRISRLFQQVSRH